MPTNKKKSFLIIEGCNFIDCPVGGQLSFAKQLIDVYGEDVALVGVTDRDDIPIGEWVRLKINKHKMDFFAFRRISCSGSKPLIPARISDYFAIKKYKKRILSKNKNAITQAPELLIAIHNWGWNSLCYEFPGVENPLNMSRFKWGIYFTEVYEKFLFNAIKNVDVILASAGHEAIKSLVDRSKGVLSLDSIKQFPTRVDTNFFKPSLVNKKSDLGMDHSDLILVTCGRINAVKGWGLVLESFKILKQNRSNIQLYFVGDGEDREKLKNKIKDHKLTESIHITGYQTSYQVLNWLNVADLILVGSYKEGWSISMLETLACGKAIITTDVSGAKEMIDEGENGFIVKSRDPEDFVDAIKRGLNLTCVKDVSMGIASKYALSSLRIDLDRLWKRKNEA